MTDDRTILFIDNYDSFSWNLVALFRQAGRRLVVRPPDDPAIPALDPHAYAGIVLSPGPGKPDDHPPILDLVMRNERTPIFGICLGMQTIGHAMGLPLRRLSYPRHGHPADIVHDGTTIFRGLPSPLRATRYHSLGFFADEVDPRGPLAVVATTEDEGRTIVMALRHRERPFIGVQFHPESFLSTSGPQLVDNFLQGIT